MALRLRDGDSAGPLRRVNAEQRVFLSGTTVDGACTGRICVLSHRTEQAHVDEAVTALLHHAPAA